MYRWRVSNPHHKDQLSLPPPTTPCFVVSTGIWTRIKRIRTLGANQLHYRTCSVARSICGRVVKAPDSSSGQLCWREFDPHRMYFFEGWNWPCLVDQEAVKALINSVVTFFDSKVLLKTWSLFIFSLLLDAFSSHSLIIAFNLTSIILPAAEKQGIGD